jgi:hypothetical protein
LLSRRPLWRRCKSRSSLWKKQSRKEDVASVGTTTWAGGILPTSLWQWSVPYLEQPPIGFVAVAGSFGENIESDVAALDVRGQFPFDLEAVTD